MGKIQLPAIGGIRKVIKTGDTANIDAALAILQAQLNRVTAVVNALASNPSSGGGGGSGPTAFLTPGPGMTGGGPLLGPVAIGLTGPLAIMLDGDGGGGDSEPGPPGQRGVDGVTGAGGPMGPAVFMAADNGEDGWGAVPGRDGTNGNTGAAGPAGPAIFMTADQGDQGDFVPGPAGPQGPAGPAGSGGGGGQPVVLFFDDGVEGDPGPPGPAGAAGGSASVPLPGTTSGLVYWFKADPIVAASGALVPVLPNSCPWFPGYNMASVGGGATISATPLNSLNVLSFPGTALGRYLMSGGGLFLPQLTIFAVCRPTNFSAAAVIAGGSNGGPEVSINATTGQLLLVKAFTAVIATATNPFTAATWSQQNVTYNQTTGAYAFRASQAANGSGTNAVAFSNGLVGIGYNPASSSQDLLGSLAEVIVYNRVLSGPEIAAIEAYLFAKWGV